MISNIQCIPTPFLWVGQAPQTVVATAATSITGTGFTANWNSSSGTTSYRLDVSTNSSFSSFVSGFNDLNVGNVTSYAVAGLSPGATYYYRLRAVNASGTSANSNTITVTDIAAAPVATAASSVTDSGFTANWNSSTGATSYSLDVSTSNTFSSFVAGFNNLNVGNVTSYAVTGLTPGVTYYYRLRAVDSGGTSGNSNTISQTTVLAAPVATAATDVTGTSFTATWTSSTGATSYRLDVSATYTFSSFLTGFNDLNVGNVTSYAVAGLNPEQTYYYRLRAVSASATSANSNTISAEIAWPYDSFESYAGESAVQSLANGINWSGAWVDRNGLTGIYDLDGFEDYADGAAVNALNSGNAGWSAAWVDRAGLLGIKDNEDYESYTDAADVNGLNGGVQGWGGARVDR